MKKTLLISVLALVMGMQMFAQSPQTTATKDSITVQDIAKIRYVVGYVVNEYAMECYRDSIPVTDLIGKPIGGSFWKEKGQYYWDIYTPLPNVKYLHRRMTAEGLLERLQTALGGS